MSKKTPSVEKPKTKSEHRSKFVLGFLLLVASLSLIAAISILRTDSKTKNHTNQICQAPYSKSARFYCEVKLEHATTPAQRTLGLSGRASMPSNSGMLFIFGTPAQECIWMKDMKFNLDIVWLDEDKKIIKLMENVSPSTYPETFCADNTKYVIELNSARASSYGFVVGDSIQL